MVNEEYVNKYINYEIIDVLSEIGGLFTILTFFIEVIFQIYNYKRNSLAILKEIQHRALWKRGNTGEIFTVDLESRRLLSILCFLYDIY